MEEIGWHFTGKTLRDGSPIPPIGVPLVHSGPVVMCKSGLHYSRTPFEALRYAPGPYLHKVKVIGVNYVGDKGVGKERIILKSLDATDLLYKFARQQALSVSHLWNCPTIVLTYLKTGENRSAAWYAAEYAARSAARSAAWYAAEYAARSAARSAAWSAARYAAEYAAWSAARYAAEYAAEYAARSEAWSDAPKQFNQMVGEAFNESC